MLENLLEGTSLVNLFALPTEDKGLVSAIELHHKKYSFGLK